MTLRKILMILPMAAFTVSPALAQSAATPKPAKPAHHATHKHVHHTKAHAAPTTAKSAS
ncbi:MAG: hypothetical protein ACREF1_15980 [Acetobacteraceae bacterium]